jgi:hypothetical protein
VTRGRRTEIRRLTPDGVPRRVVLLGASNLTKGIGTILETAYRAWGRPLEVLGALGHGRSYGRTSSLLGRQLPGILECSLWADLAALPPAPTAALVTDIGNDLFYEEPTERIAASVERCLDHLAAVQARTVVTLLPVENLQTLSRARFQLLRSVFFPRSRVGLEEVSRRAFALNEQVRRLAVERGFALVRHRTAWYGFDPIHIRFRQRPAAWREILASWSSSTERYEPAGNALARTLYLRSRTPACRRVLGFEQRAGQPSGRLNDGTTVAIY